MYPEFKPHNQVDKIERISEFADKVYIYKFSFNVPFLEEFSHTVTNSLHLETILLNVILTQQNFLLDWF